MGKIDFNQNEGPAFTTRPVAAGDFSGATSEFGRTPDVERCFGIKKGTLYNLLEQGKIRGSNLRLAGQFKGVRLWDMASIRDYIYSQMD